MNSELTSQICWLAMGYIVPKARLYFQFLKLRIYQCKIPLNRKFNCEELFIMCPTHLANGNIKRCPPLSLMLLFMQCQLENALYSSQNVYREYIVMHVFGLSGLKIKTFMCSHTSILHYEEDTLFKE